MSKKDKPDLNLDFDELGSVEKVVNKIPRSQKATKKAAPKSKLADIVLSIPIKEDPLKFTSKTIENCSGVDFIRWAKNVAYSLDKNQEHYDDETNRSSAFLRILSFHRKTFILANPDSVKTLH
jgi:hypothetical protein